MICKYCSGSGLPGKKKAAGLPRICCLRRRRRLRRGCAGGFAARRRSAGSPPPTGGRARSRALPRPLHKLKSMGQAPLPTGAYGAGSPGRDSVKGAVLEPLFAFNKKVKIMGRSPHGLLTPAPQRAPAAGEGTVAEAPAAVRRLPPAPAAAPFPVWGLSASARPSFSPLP